MKENKHIYERLEGSGHHDFFTFLGDLNALEGVGNRLNLPQNCRIVTNPNDIPPPKRSQEQPENPSTGV